MIRFSMNLILVFLLAFNPLLASAAIEIDVDTLSSPDKTVEVAMPVVSGTMTTNNNTQTLTNKTLTTPTVDVPLFDGQGSSPSAPSAGYFKMYFKDSDSKPYYMSSAGSETAFGTGAGGGGTNHVTNYDAETDTTGHTLYADAAGVAPVDGTAGSSSLTLSRTTSAGEFLRGTASFKIAKSATNEQGEGVGINFTVALADYNPPQMQTIEFNYKASANFDYGAGTAADPSDIVVYIYARDSGTLIQPSNYQLDGSGKFLAQFQPLTTDDDYRLILHVAGVNALAWDFFYDEVKVGPTNIARGPPVTDPVSWTPTGSWVTNAVYTGKKWRVGQWGFYEVNVSLNGAPTAANLTINMPSGEVIDSNALLTTSSRAYYGGGTFYDNSTSAPIPLQVIGSSTTAVGVGYIDTDNAQSNSFTWVDASNPVVGAVSDSVVVRWAVPIVGWGSGAQFSTDGDRPVVMRATLTTAQTGVTDKVIPFNSATRDTHSMLNTSTGVATVKVSGDYLTCFGTKLDSMDGSTNPVVNIRKNSVTYAQVHSSVLPVTTSSSRAGSCDIISLMAGETVDIYVDGDVSFDIDNSSGRTTFTMDRIGAYGTVMATETVAGHYGAGTTSWTSGAGPSVAIFSTKVDDSHGSTYNTSTGIWTAPASGRYWFNYQVADSSVTASSVGGSFQISLQKNGSGEYCVYSQQARTTSAAAMYVSSSCMMNLLAGDQIKVIGEDGLGTGFDLVNNSGYSFFEWVRIGNP